jgi:hypothetical protein
MTTGPNAPAPVTKDHCVKHGPHAPGECPQCDELAEARSIVATTYIPPAPPTKEAFVSRDRPSPTPGGCECQHCGRIFVGDESRQFCGVCVEIVSKELKRIQDGR